MILYVLIAFFLAVFMATYELKGRKSILVVDRYRINQKAMFSAAFAMLGLFLLTALRAHNIGNDTNNYVKLFENIAGSGKINISTSRFEIGFQIYCLLISKITDSPQLFLGITAAICYGITWRFCLAYCNNQIGFVVVFFSLFFSKYISGIRQALAMCICLVAYTFIKKNRYYIGGLFIILATTFHFTSIVAFLYYIIPIVKKRKQFFFTFISFLLLLLIIIRNTNLNDTLDFYFNYYERYYSAEGRSNIGILSCTLTLVQIAYSILVYRYCLKKNKKDAIAFNDSEIEWFSYAMLFFCVINFVANNFSRILWFFEIPFYTSLLNRVSILNIKKRKICLLSVAMLLMFSFFINLALRPEYYNLIPYRFFWADISRIRGV